VVKGKLGYMSPEQSAARRIDKRTDIFSLGVVIHELCTLVHPFVHDDPILTFDAIQRRDPEPMARLHPAAAPLDPIVARATAKDPNDRYADCEAMRRDLNRLMTAGALPPPTESLREYVQTLFAAELARTRQRRRLRASYRWRPPVLIRMAPLTRPRQIHR